MIPEDSFSQQPALSPIEVGLLSRDGPVYKRRRIAPALVSTDITPNTYRASPLVLTPSQVQAAYHELAEGDALRIGQLKQIRTANIHMLQMYPEVALYAEGRALTKEGISRDGWWGDITEVSRWAFLKEHGKRLAFISSQPSFFGKNGQDAVRGIQMPEEVLPFQFHPFSLPEDSSLVDFLYQQQTSNTVFLAPLNARFPILFRLKKRNGKIDFTEETKRTIGLLEKAIYGGPHDNFTGIPMSMWDQICHQLHAMQVMADMIGTDTTSWTEFPRPYLNPPAAARFLAESYASSFAQDAMNTLIHIGTATNYKPKADKYYPPEKWKEVLTLISNKKPDNVGSVILFKPINPKQARETEDIAEHARRVFGNEKVAVLPITQDWDWAAFVAFLDELTERGILVGVDSGPAHMASARRVPLVQVGNRRFDPEFYAPEGGMIVLPAHGKQAKYVRPEDVAETFLTVIENLFRN